MQNLFDKVPSNFFNYLGSSSNNRVYSDCLLLIYNEYENEISYRLPRDQIRDAIIQYLMDECPDFCDEEYTSDKTYVDKASRIIRNFCATEVGWLEEDSDEATFEKQIIMSEKGILLAEFLERLMMPEREEFSSYIFNIYNTLSNKEQWKEEPYSLCLYSVYKNSRSLSKSLKKLATFIRRTIEEMMNEDTFKSLTENLISYCEGDFIKEYSRLCKSQNIHIYRRQIVSKLAELQNSEEEYENVVKGCQSELNIDRLSAENKVYEIFEKTRIFLEIEYDAIMKDIRTKLNVYLKIAVGRGRSLRNRSANVRSSVERTIWYLVKELEDIDVRDDLPEECMDLFMLEKNEYISLESITYPKKQKAIKKVVETEYENITEEEILAAKRNQEKQAYNPYSKNKMKKYLNALLAENDCITAEQMPLQDKEDVLASIAAVAYADENGFEVIPLEGYLETNELLIRNFEIQRRQK